ncbi:hypothetical protein NFI96_000374 [Prochilodus magdalenae]|nr:hypothetical protein NFI96_000374 [Prochilodus magdalenae]
MSLFRDLLDTMSQRKYLLATARLAMPAVGLCLLCVGIIIKSINSDDLETLIEISTYLLIILGLILIALGALLSVGYRMKSVLVKWSWGRTRNNDVQVFTVDRASFYPPSYEESQIRHDAEEGNVIWRPGPAPPVYTENSLETCNEDFSHEEPPTYQQAILHDHPAPQTTCLPTNSSLEPL